MKVQVKTKGVVLTSKQKSQIEKQIMRLKRFVNHVEPVTIEVSFVDETGPTRGGIDQTVRINATLPKESIFVEEIDDRPLRAFQYAYKILERRLRRYSDKMVGDRRRQGSRVKGIINYVGGSVYYVGRTAGGAIGRIVPRKRKK